MRRLLISIGSLIALSTALPAFASDVTSDRYAPSREARVSERATPRVSAPRAKQDETKPCSCSCARESRDDRSVTRAEPGAH